MQSGCSRIKLDVFRQSGLTRENEIYSGKSCCIGEKCLYSGKNCCIRAVVIVPTLAPLLASDWLILALLTSSKLNTSQRPGDHVGVTLWGVCLRYRLLTTLVPESSIGGRACDVMGVEGI